MTWSSNGGSIEKESIAPGPIWTPLQVTGGATQDKITTFGGDTPWADPGNLKSWHRSTFSRRRVMRANDRSDSTDPRAKRGSPDAVFRARRSSVRNRLGTIRAPRTSWELRSFPVRDRIDPRLIRGPYDAGESFSGFFLTPSGTRRIWIGSVAIRSRLTTVSKPHWEPIRSGCS